MLQQIEGSKAIAHTVAACQPEVISAYPISPQTHIVEELSRMVKAGELGNTQYVNVESEFGAMSVCIGASATGARTYTATASQGLLFMAEAIYSASGLGLPIVMTVANRAIGGPINIWNDHSDTMSQRDCGWLQLFAKDNQEAADLHVQAFRLAEELSIPVMVCMDGFILTHAVEQVDVPDPEQIAQFLPPFEPRIVLDPADPVSLGAMVGPEAFTEVKYLQHWKQMEALKLIPEIGKEFSEIFGRENGGLLHEYRTEDADTIVVCLGSITGTLRDAIDIRREQGEKIGVLSLVAFRPFPAEAVRKALGNASTFVVVEKAFSVGIGGILAGEVRMAMRGHTYTDYECIAGLGGRDITIDSINAYLDTVRDGTANHLHFLDLNQRLIDSELKRQQENRRSGPIPENMIRDITSMMTMGGAR